MTILSRGIFPDKISGLDLTTRSPSLATLASRQYWWTSFQYSPVFFPIALGGGLPEVSSCLAILQAWLASWQFFHDSLFVKPREVNFQFFLPSSQQQSWQHLDEDDKQTNKLVFTLLETLRTSLDQADRSHKTDDDDVGMKIFKLLFTGGWSSCHWMQKIKTSLRPFATFKRFCLFIVKNLQSHHSTK